MQFVRAESHILRERPSLLFQVQMLKRLWTALFHG